MHGLRRTVGMAEVPPLTCHGREEFAADGHEVKQAEQKKRREPKAMTRKATYGEFPRRANGFRTCSCGERRRRCIHRRPPCKRMRGSSQRSSKSLTNVPTAPSKLRTMSIEAAK